MAKKNTAAVAEELAQPILEEMGLLLWDVVYEKEGSGWYLRYYVDREGGIDINSCEAFSRAVEKVLDAADPIEGSYTLEVGSAGAERALKRPSDFQRFLNSPVLVKLYRNLDGRKEFAGTLAAYDESTGDVTITVGKQDMTFAKKDVALVRLRVEF